MDISPAITVLVVLGFVVFGFIPIPIWARLGVQIVVGLGIYFGLDDATFNLPNGDNLPLSGLMGGTGGMGGFSYLSMGFVCIVLGLLSTVAGTVLHKVLRKGGKGE